MFHFSVLHQEKDGHRSNDREIIFQTTRQQSIGGCNIRNYVCIERFNTVQCVQSQNFHPFGRGG